MLLSGFGFFCGMWVLCVFSVCLCICSCVGFMRVFYFVCVFCGLRVWFFCASVIFLELGSCGVSVVCLGIFPV